MRSTIYHLFLLLSLALFAGTACRKVTAAGAAGPTSESLLNYLQNNYSFSLFYHAIQVTGLDSVLNGTTAYTLLVADNDAFARDSIFTTDSLDHMNSDTLLHWMQYHIVPGSIRVADIPQTVNNLYTTISRLPIYLSRPEPGEFQKQTDFAHLLHINGVNVNTPDVIASDGVIQVLNTPLKIPVASVQAYLSSHPEYSELVTGLQHFGLWDQLSGPGPFTIFAPNNASFDGINVTPDSVNVLDTVRFQKSLFGIYVLTPARVFLTDLIDVGWGGTGAGGQNAFITTSGTYTYYNGDLIDPGIDPVTQQPVPYAYWTETDNITLNGVVQGMQGVLLTPGQTTK